MSDKLVNKALIILELDIGQREFDDLEDLRQWCQDERRAFAWLAEVSRQERNLAQTWAAYHGWLEQVSTFIQQYERLQGNEQQQRNLISGLKNQTRQAIQNQGLRTSESPDAKFALDLSKRESPVIAGYALGYLMGQNVNFSTRPGLEGVYWAMQYRRGDTETVQASRDALESLKRSWSTRFGKQHKKLADENQRLTAEISDLRNQFSSLQEDASEQIQEQEKQFDALIDQTERQLENIKRTYDEKLALQSSVAYWSDKRTHHQWVMWGMAAVTAASATLTFQTFTEMASRLLDAPLSQVPLWALGVMLAISTFGIWITRLSAKIFISNLHLRTDADERVTMIQTYLALLREGSGPLPEERQLILQTLFRPSTSGFIKDEGPAGFYESISRSLGK